MPRIRDYAYYNSISKEEGQALKATMFEKEAKVKETDKTNEPENEAVVLRMVEQPASVDNQDEAEPQTKVNNDKQSNNETKKNNLSEVKNKVAKGNSVVPSGAMVEKTVINELDLEPKYTNASVGFSSIVEDGAYYEDYTKGAANGLTKDKDFVLAVIAQNPERFFSPLTPTPPEWIDEEFVVFTLKNLFEEIRESENETAVEAATATLYEFLLKAAFNETAYTQLTSLTKLVAKIESAKAINLADAERVRVSATRFFEAIKTAKQTIKARYEAKTNEIKERKNALSTTKKGLFSFIDETPI